MSNKQDSLRFDVQQKIYSLSEIAEYARVSIEFIEECERENLIRVSTVRSELGYSHDTVRRLIRIRHLHRDLGLDLSAIDCLLRMRRQVTDLQRRLGDMEEQMSVRERELMDEIQRLRRKLAHNSNWQTR